MKFILITSFVPTPDNYRGPSAMMYHFLKARESNCQVKIFALNNNGVPEDLIRKSAADLKAEIIILKDNLYNYFHKRHTLADLRITLHIDKYYGESNYRLPKSVLQQIDTFNPDFIWIYGEDKTTIIKQVSEKYTTLVAGYDCFPLHYSRLLADPYSRITEKKYKEILHKNKVAISRELALREVPCTYFDVGIADRNMFQEITGRTDARFYPHPHFNYKERNIDFHKPVLSILISGTLDEYTYTDAHKMLRVLCNNCDLAAYYSITFVGKGWELFKVALQDAGYNTTLKTWVDDYTQELANHDVQIFPISVGSGTKGKVLCAMTMGILCIGSAIAMENIFAKSGYSCYQYDSIDQVSDFLRMIQSNRTVSAQMAEHAREDVLRWHNPKRILDNILNDVLGGKDYNGREELESFIGLVSLNESQLKST